MYRWIACIDHSDLLRKDPTDKIIKCKYYFFEKLSSLLGSGLVYERGIEHI